MMFWDESDEVGLGAMELGGEAQNLKPFLRMGC